MTEFIFTGKPCVRGHDSPRYARFGGCVQCVRENNLRQIANNKVARANRFRVWRHKNREHYNALVAGYRKRDPKRFMLNAARCTAKRKGVPFDLSINDFEIPDICPVLGLALYKSSGKRTANTPSLDRIIPSLGYVKDNVIVVSWRANRIKADASVDELEAIATFYKKLMAH